jgi:HlyD family secretion protein
MTENQVDLSQLKIPRGDTSRSGAPSSVRRIILIAGGLLLVLVLAVIVFLRSGNAEEVECATVAMMSPSAGNTLLTSSGYVVAQRKAAIASKATGRIMSLGFKEGDKVRTGQVIARIESADVEAALAQARAEFRIAQSDSTDASQILDRTTTLFSRQLVAQAEYDAAKARFDRVVATMASKAAAVRAAEVQVENTNIRAPFDGTILSKNADVGEVVAPFGAGASSKVAVVTIADMGSLEVEADVAEANIERITLGQPCEISLDANPDKRYRGSVDKIVPTADRAKATVLTKIRFLEKDQRVLPEMSAKVQFLSAQTPATVDSRSFPSIDRTAVVTRNDHTTVFVFNSGRAEERAVTTGRQTGAIVEVTQGLSAGEQVILHPSASLTTGSSVKIKQH